MAGRNGWTRREVLGAGAATAAVAAGSGLLNGCTGLSNVKPTPAVTGLGYFSRFGVDERLLRETLAIALSRGGDYADLYFQHRVGHAMAVEDGEVNRASSQVELGVGVRVVKGDQTGYAYTEDFDRESLRRAAQTAAAIADGPARPGPQALHVVPLKAQRYPCKRGWEAVRPEERVPLLAALNAQALAADPRLKKANVSLTDEAGTILIADSEGRLVEDYQPMTSFRLSLVAEQGGRRESNAESLAGRAGFEFCEPRALEAMVKRAVQRTLVLFEAGQPPAGEMPVVLAAGTSGILLHEAIGHGLEADFNRKGISIFADRLGQRVAHPFVTIVDDAEILSSRGAINVDDEGHPGQRTTLVENGVLTGYLHDSISARHYKVGPTGNGRRQSYAFPPVPRMRVTYMQNGPHRREEVLGSVKKGIYCEQFTNGQVNIGAGDFTFFVKNGWLIEDGKLTRPIKDVNVIGNGPKVLEQIDMVADDLVIDQQAFTCGKDGQGVPVSMGLPTVRVASMTVGGRGA